MDPVVDSSTTPTTPVAPAGPAPGSIEANHLAALQAERAKMAALKEAHAAEAAALRAANEAAATSLREHEADAKAWRDYNAAKAKATDEANAAALKDLTDAQREAVKGLERDQLASVLASFKAAAVAAAPVIPAHPVGGAAQQNSGASAELTQDERKWAGEKGLDTTVLSVSTIRSMRAKFTGAKAP
jgi:hypothetical protein